MSISCLERAIALSRQLIQNSESRVLDTLQDNTLLEYQSIMTQRYMKPSGMGRIVIIGAFAAIVAVAIGFAIWDRRTMIRPFEFQVKEINSCISDEQKKVARLLEAFRQFAKEDKRIEVILRNLSLFNNILPQSYFMLPQSGVPS